MNTRFQRGLVVGKFSPLHRGHELVIRRAMDECAEVVIISYCKPEMPGCDAARRDNWLAALFPETHRLVVTDERLRQWLKSWEAEIPQNDADERTHRQFCGFLCQEALGVSVDAVFTSEEYGDGFAEELTRYFRQRQPLHHAVRHVQVDRQRRAFPISGTRLRQNIHVHREWVSPRVYASFVQRVCVLGGESTGKSTLAAALARKFQTLHVPEFGRELWETKTGALTFADMRHIADVQIQREEEAALGANQFLFCDTSPLTTLFYSRHLFGKSEPVLEALADRAYDLTILCAPDFPFVQDGTRQENGFRARQHQWYLDELARRAVGYLLVSGSVAARIAQVRAALASGNPGMLSPANVR